MSSSFTKGIIHGQELKELFDYANQKDFAIPAVNVIGTNSMNAVMETARDLNSPVIIQFSNGGSTFNAVVLHTDHCAKKLLPWIKGLIQEGAKHFEQTGIPLYSSHMLDLSEEPIEENLDISCEYFEEMNKLGMMIEIELGVTGGEEDGVDNTDIDSSRLYTQPDEVAYSYERLMKISDRFTVAAAFGNVHGVYKPGNVELKPIILKNSQDHIKKTFNTGDQPVNFVFHGGSGCSTEEIREAIGYGAVKMNIDTDMQWAFWDGVKGYYEANKDYLQGQLGNPTGDDVPNKKYYDPRKWLRTAEGSFKTRLTKAFEDLNCVDVL